MRSTLAVLALAWLVGGHQAYAAQTRTSAAYDPQALARDVERIQTRVPLSDADGSARADLIAVLQTEGYGTLTHALTYAAALDVVEAEISGAPDAVRIDVDAELVKAAVIAGLKGRFGFSDAGLCSVPLVFRLSDQLAQRFVSTGLRFDPTLPGCHSDVSVPSEPASISSDTLIAYVGSEGSVWVTRPNGEGARRVAVNPSTTLGFVKPRWSPDGRMLTFGGQRRTQFGVEPNGVFVHDGSNLRPVTNADRCELPTFLPDGSGLLLVCDGDDLVAVDLSGSNRRVLAADVAGGVSTWLVSHVEFARTDGTLVVQLFNLNRGWVNYGFLLGAGAAGLAGPRGTDGWAGIPRFAHDGGDMLAWSCDACGSREGGPGELGTAIVRVSRDGEVLGPIAQIPGDLGSPSGVGPTSAPTGSAIAYAMAGGSTSSVVVTILPDGPTRRIAEGVDPDWQPVPAPVG